MNLKNKRWIRKCISHIGINEVLSNEVFYYLPLLNALPQEEQPQSGK